ncbi:MAG: hypothetical protein GY751_23885 [Bacteroidetes bacterium]|nr:hypothetical protein [Bacteroidota bacterium]
MVPERIRKRDCSQITDGGAVIVPANYEKANEYAGKHGLSIENLPYIKGWGHTTGPITLAAKWALSTKATLCFPI